MKKQTIAFAFILFAIACTKQQSTLTDQQIFQSTLRATQTGTINSVCRYQTSDTGVVRLQNILRKDKVIIYGAYVHEGFTDTIFRQTLDVLRCADTLINYQIVFGKKGLDCSNLPSIFLAINGINVYGVLATCKQCR